MHIILLYAFLTFSQTLKNRFFEGGRGDLNLTELSLINIAKSHSTRHKLVISINTSEA